VSVTDPRVGCADCVFVFVVRMTSRWAGRDLGFALEKRGA
jgi:hypothetical protein